MTHEVSRWLGHKPIKATVDIYSNLIPEAWDRYARSWQTRSDFVRSVTDWMCWISFDGAGSVLDARAFLHVKGSS
ncbi:hypothetical protein ACWD0Z_38430 [Streptomyces sp. NPDC003007]